MSVYTSTIEDHANHPRNAEPFQGANLVRSTKSPICGDSVVLACRVLDNRLERVALITRGCALSRASASILGDRVKGRTISEALEEVSTFHAAVTTMGAKLSSPELEALLAVRDLMPHRVKCVTLPWLLLREALQSS